MKSMPVEESRLNDKPCPRCGCYLIRSFVCGCGDVHEDYCCNCGRWTILPVTEHATLGHVDIRCDAGPVAHVHSEEEKSQRVKDYFDSVVRSAQERKN